MRDTLSDGLKTALKNRDRVAVSALRSALSAIGNAEAVPVDDQVGPAAVGEHVAGAAAGPGAAEAERRALTGADVRSIVEGEVRERSTAAAEYERLGRDDVAERLRAEAEVLNRYLGPGA
ncbi:GatB/YqeY domain-containing protein [Saccharothrix xinjiangensis]|uniref:GatB/YqeY domain-containing protein n=1 Tax=Saccharothrix xinjiangensis TaxID=204798 RepID=A0ABV9Y1M9_9PSEU